VKIGVAKLARFRQGTNQGNTNTGRHTMKRPGFIRDMIGATILFISWYVIFVLMMSM
jgi:hypothetical protein